MGIAQVPDYMAREALCSRALVEVLQRHRPAPVPISLIYPCGRHVPRLLVLIDLLADVGLKRAGLALSARRSAC